MTSSVLVAWTFCLGVMILPCPAFGQGQVSINNTPGTMFFTNAVAIGGTSGRTGPTRGVFLYEVLTAPSYVKSVDVSLQDLLSSPWSDTGLRGTNNQFVGREQGDIIDPTVNFWPAGQTNSFLVVGWSTNLGNTWSEVASELSGASLVGQNGGFMWQGGGLISNDGSLAFLGATTVGFRQAGGVVGTGTIPTPMLFGSVDDAQGEPIKTTTTLWVVAPEPSVFALAMIGFGGLSAWRGQARRAGSRSQLSG